MGEKVGEIGGGDWELPTVNFQCVGIDNWQNEILSVSGLS